MVKKRVATPPSPSPTADQPPTAEKSPQAAQTHRMVPTLRVVYHGERGIVKECAQPVEHSRLPWILGRNSGDRLGLAGDLQISRKQARLRISGSQLLLRDGVDSATSSHGTFVNGRRISDQEVQLSEGDIIRIGDTFLCVAYWPANFDEPNLLPAIRGQSLACHELRRRVLSAAGNEAASCVLLLGESGTGKELVAKQIHAHSKRAQEPFVIADLGKVPANRESFLSELFGHDRGAFTGATTDRQGRFEEAQGGVILLDELGEVPLDQQPALLRVLETRCIQRLGASSRLRPIDVRVIAATNRDLALDVEQGSFRNDLYGRLQEYILRLPPLRSRREDILLFVQEGLGQSADLNLDSELVSALLLYPWPRNVREALATGETLARNAQELRASVLTSETAPLWLQQAMADATAKNPSAVDGELGDFKPRREALGLNKTKLVAALSETYGNVSAAAEILGVDRKTIHRWMAAFGISRNDFRARPRS